MKIIVIGCGTIGKTIIKNVSKEGHKIVIIDTNKYDVEELIERYDVMGIVGNGASLDIQREAGVKGADLVVAVTPQDEINILACLVSKKLGAKSTVARVRNPEYRRQSILMQEELGLSMIVNPEEETAKEIADMINLPSLLKMETFAKGAVNLIEIKLEENNPLVGETLISMSKKLKSKVLICAVERKDEVIIPSGNFKLEIGDRINVTADSQSIVNFLKELSLITTPLKNIMIIGGGRISYYLAKGLDARKHKIKIFEYNREKAHYLAENLPRVTVLCSDGTEQDTLLEEGIEVTDACISLTGVDEENIILSMYAKKIGVPKVITKLNRDGLYGMTGELGLEGIVSPKDIVANKIISYIRSITNVRGSNVISLSRLVNNQVEALEFNVKKNSKILNTPLKDLIIKKNCLIASIIRDEQVIIPKGDDCIMLGDHVVVVTTHRNFDDLKDAFE